jgi:hypothetical protein
MIFKNMYIWFEEYNFRYIFTMYIRFEEYDKSMKMNEYGQTRVDGRGRMDRI